MANYQPPKENFFTTERKESLTAKLSLRVPPSLLEKIKKEDNWQEAVRNALLKEFNSKTA